MAWTHYQRVLAILMVITGSLNTLSVKYADLQIVKGQDEEPRHFNHPFMQSSFMFLGEMSCMLLFKIAFCYYTRQMNGSVDSNSLTKGSRNFSPLVLLAPAMCDMFATSLMYVGLNMTYASSFQMLRGAVIVFTGILSVGFLDRKLGSREWFGISLIINGLSLVGMSDFIMQNDSSVSTNSIITGDLLIICAQVITAVQMVVEEKYVSGLDIPALQAVGWEGVFGFIGICLAMIPLNYIYALPPFANNSRGTLEATVDAFVQIGNSIHLLMAIIGMTVSIAFFNFAGVSVTKEMSATTRMVLDSVRTLVIWAFSLAFQWQTFHYLQLIGFAVLLIGMSCYNNIVVPQLFRKIQCRLGRRQPQQDEESIITTAADDVADKNE
ncbi:solute carrier family 35 member F6 [Neodiprion virginianus]|uniref:Solute carrier family 35 member F6 n=1 Tax=Neodiprion lecontei TaxID=441921 RepID=A0A6J0BL05_NEOLC|nr:solute carrier family 35 member F6 [Neodiprion lecontei]XP_046423196.1 solute carrier family 35 member F6 [Neodiprion fabricii]XP_046616897.1 solute carrier family 35 member F6 [Neodiprion virginianus]